MSEEQKKTYSHFIDTIFPAVTASTHGHPGNGDQ